MDILKGLQNDELDAIRDAFSSDPNGLELDDFVACLARFRADPQEADPQGSLKSLFRTIDFDGDERITWDEFTSFAVDACMREAQQKPHDLVPTYTCRRTHVVPYSIGHIQNVRNWGPDGKIATFGKGKPLRIYHPKTFAVVSSTPPELFSSGAEATCCEYVPPGSMFAVASSDSKLRILDRDFSVRQTLVLEAALLKLQWSQHHGVLFGGTRHGCLNTIEVARAYDFADKVCRSRVVHTYQMHEKPLTDFQIHDAFPNRVFTCSLDGTIKLLDLEQGPLSPGTPVPQLVGTHASGVLGISYSHDCGYLCSIGHEDQAHCWTTASRGMSDHRLSLVDHSSPHRAAFAGIHAVPGTPEVITMDVAGYVKVWDLRTFNCVQTFLMGWSPEEEYPPQARHASFCYVDSCNTLVGAEGRRVCVHEQEHEARRSEGVSNVFYNATQRSFVTTSGRDLKIWDVKQGCLTSHFLNVTSSDITALALDEFGRRVYVGTQDGSLSARIYHTADLIYSYSENARHSAEVFAMEYMSGKRQLLSSAIDGSVLLHADKDGGRVAVRVLQPAGAQAVEAVHLGSSCPLSLFVCASAKEITVRDFGTPRKPVMEIVPPDGESIVAVSFLGAKGCIVLSGSTGRLHLMSTRPMMVRLDTGMSDVRCAVLARWANSVGSRSAADAMCRAADELLLRREARREARRERQRVTGSHSGNDAEEEEDLAGLYYSESRYHGVKQDFYRSESQFPAASALCYDEHSHVLWTGDREGYVTAWMLCPVFKHHDLHDTSYPVALERDGTVPESAFLHRTLPCHDLDDEVPVLRSWRAHADEVRHLRVHNETGIVVTSGDDRRVLVWGCQGVLVSELSFGAHYAHYGACSVPVRADSKPIRGSFALGDVFMQLSQLADFYYTGQPGSSVVLAALLKRLGCADRVATSAVCGHPVPRLPRLTVQAVVALPPEERAAALEVSPFHPPTLHACVLPGVRLPPASASAAVAAAAEQPQALQALCNEFVRVVTQHKAKPAAPADRRRETRTADKRGRAAMLQHDGDKQERRRFSLQDPSGRGQKARGRRATLQMNIGLSLPPPPPPAPQGEWWCVGVEQTHSPRTHKPERREYVFQSSAAAPAAGGAEVQPEPAWARRGRPATAPLPLARGEVPACVQVKRVAAMAVASIAALPVLACAALEAGVALSPLRALRSAATEAEGRRFTHAAPTLDLRAALAAPEALALQQRKGSDCAVFSNETGAAAGRATEETEEEAEATADPEPGSQEVADAASDRGDGRRGSASGGGVCAEWGGALDSMQADLRQWADMPLPEKRSLEVRGASRATPVAVCAGSAGVHVDHVHQRRCERRRVRPASARTPAPTLEQLLAKAPPGAARLPAPVPAPPKRPRPRSGLLGRRVHIAALKALSNGCRPRSASAAGAGAAGGGGGGIHTAALSPVARSPPRTARTPTIIYLSTPNMPP